MGSLRPASRRTATRHPAAVVLGLLLALVAVAVAACGGDDGTDEVTAGAGDGEPQADDGGASTAAPGRIDVHLEEVEGFFIEGFEVGLRFETGAGELIAATRWSDFVSSTGRDGMEAYYDSVLAQPVPAGAVVVSAEVNVGVGPPPSVPDLDGPLPCRVEVDVAPEEVVAIEVSFDGSDECLRVADGASPTGPSTSGATASAPTTSTSTASAPTTSAPAPSLAVGTSHYVDVDLECQAFELAGSTWVLEDGDTSTWQPPGERHEGGTFTIERDGFGRFVGDAAGEKTATFRRLDDGTEPPCAPVPRPRP